MKVGISSYTCWPFACPLLQKFIKVIYPLSTELIVFCLVATVTIAFLVSHLSSLSDNSSKNIFSHFTSCLFAPMIISFTLQKLFSVI